MADIKFIPKARNANAIPEEPFSNGSLIAATDTGELYVDYNGARMRIGDVITLETEAQRLATLAPLPKLYWVAETSKLWRFANDWVCVNPDDIEADTLSIGKSTFFNVASYTHNGNVYELLLKTAIYKGSGAANILIRVHGNCGDSIVDFTVHLYWYNNSYTYRAAVNNGSIQPTLKAFSYTADKEYVGLAIIGLMYYPRLTVDMFDMWSINRNYDNNWTIEANTTSSATSIVPPEDLTDIVWQPIYSDIEANTIEANMIKADIVQADRWYYGVAKVSSGIPVYEIVVKTRIPVINQSAVNTIHLYGSDNQFVVDTTLVLYWQNTTAKFPWRHIINAGVRRIKAKVFTYEDNGTEYVGFALLPHGGAIYFGYPRFSIDFCDIMSSVRDYSKGWTVELNTVKDSTSIIPQTNLMDCIESKINSDISGSATNSEQLAGISADQYALKENYLPLTGGTLTGSLTANNFRGIVNPPINKGSYFLNEPNTSAAAYIQELMADRLQFFPPANCLLETSSDGTSWTTRSTPNAQKQQLLCCHPSYTAEIDWTAGTQLRITFTADSYVFLSLLYLYLRTSGKIDVIIEQFRNASQDWVEVARQEQVTGQPIHVVLWHTVIRFQNSTNDMHSGKVRVTLIHTGTDTPILDQLRWKGGYPTANPYIYDWDPSRNVMFPAEVRASNFNGSWNDKAVASSFDENSTSTIPTCKQVADYIKSLIGG